MGDDPKGKPKKRPMKPGTIALLGAVTVALSFINMSGSEAPPQALAIMQYALLAGGLVSLVGGLIMMMNAPQK